MDGHALLADRYEVRDLLGAGGMAEVRDGWDTRLSRPVAIKLLHPAMKAQPEFRRRFYDEALSAAKLCHPNIVAVHDYGEHDGTPFIVMERLPGRTLGDLIADAPMPPHLVRRMLDEVLDALGAAHAAGVLHRDIKPGNVLLSANGDRMQIGDFGIAKTPGVAHTLTGQLVGTLSYMSPERVTGSPASAADDLYAVGVMGYEALQGRAAFPQDTPIALARAIIDDPPPPLAQIRPDLDAGLIAAIDGAMTRDPAQRFGSAAQMRAALHSTAVPVHPTPVHPVPVHPTTRRLTPHPPAAPGRRVAPRTRNGLAAAGILGCLAVAAIALAAEPFSETPAPEPVSTSTPVPQPVPLVAPPPVSTAPLQTAAPIVDRPSSPPVEMVGGPPAGPPHPGGPPHGGPKGPKPPKGPKGPKG
jgi:serine/threonine protein kinase